MNQFSYCVWNKPFTKSACRGGCFFSRGKCASSRCAISGMGRDGAGLVCSCPQSGVGIGGVGAPWAVGGAWGLCWQGRRGVWGGGGGGAGGGGVGEGGAGSIGRGRAVGPDAVAEAHQAALLEGLCHRIQCHRPHSLSMSEQEVGQ